MKTPLIQNFRPSNKAFAFCLAALFITGCTAKHQPATQVVAKVNNDEISVHQVNNALAQMPNIAPANVPKARKEILDRLVNQELAVQQAINLKLDRSPEVMMLIDASRREILTRAYLSQIAAGLPKPSDEEVKKFYTEHPQLFTERRIYNLQELSVPNPHPPLAELKQRIAGKSMADIATMLKNDNLAFTSNNGTRAAEQIALPVLVDIAKLKDGETGVIDTGQAALIIHVDASQLSPVKEEVALQRIPQFLANEKAKLAIQDQLEGLKSHAKIEYLNEFADDGAKTGVASMKPASDQNIRAVAVVKDNAGSSIERGIAGLK